MSLKIFNEICYFRFRKVIRWVWDYDDDDLMIDFGSDVFEYIYKLELFLGNTNW